MADYDSFQYGGVVYPLTSSTSNSLLKDADPALYWTLQYFEGVLETHLKPRLIAQAALCGAAINNAVESAIGFDPGPFLYEHQGIRFPLLALYRTQTTYGDRTVVWENMTSLWECVYVLPSLNWAQAEKLLPCLHAVEHILTNRTSQGWDNTVLSGAEVFDYEHAGIEKITFREGRYGRFEEVQGIRYHAWFSTIEVAERVMPYAGEIDSLAGVDLHVNVHDAATVTTVEDVAEIDTDVTVPEEGSD